MGIYQSVRAVTGATGDGPVDWTAVTDAARAGTDAGSLELSAAEEDGYGTDVKDARDSVRTVTTLDFDLPDRVEVQNRHHWLDANVGTFERVMRPIERQAEHIFSPAQVANTGSMAFALSFLARHVLGQYDPLLLADDENHALYFVRPNIVNVADTLDVPYDRFRRWIAFHEVAHAAEFGAAPWLSEHLETTMQTAIEDLGVGTIDRDSLGQLDITMTAVEGYAELVMDEAFDEEYADLRRKVDQRREGRGPVQQLIRRLLGLNVKRRQYERGKRFFETVVDQRDIETAGLVWESPAHLPTDDELDDPQAWLTRVNR